MYALGHNICSETYREALGQKDHSRMDSRVEDTSQLGYVLYLVVIGLWRHHREIGRVQRHGPLCILQCSIQKIPVNSAQLKMSFKG